MESIPLQGMFGLKSLSPLRLPPKGISSPKRSIPERTANRFFGAIRGVLRWDVKIQMFDKFFVLAERAKSVGDLVVANYIFAFLFELWLEGEIWSSYTEFREVGYSGSTAGLWLVLETQDPEGSSTEEVYYDLLRLDFYDGDCNGEKSLCIPVPLLRPFSALAAYKVALPVDRRQHNRLHTADLTDEVRAELREELFELVPQEVLAKCSERYLELDLTA